MTTSTSPPKRGANPTGSWASTAHRRYPSPPDTARIPSGGCRHQRWRWCERYWENRRFTPRSILAAPYRNGRLRRRTVEISSSEKWKEKEPAMELYNKVKAAGCATVTKAERKEKTEETPLLYDLTTLQKEANAKHGFTAEQTLEIAQNLRKLITYPRTGSRYIPETCLPKFPNCSLHRHTARMERQGAGKSRPDTPQRGRRR